MQQHGKCLWYYVEHTNCFISTEDYTLMWTKREQGEMESCGRAVDLWVASFLACDLISFVVGCAINIKTFFSCSQERLFCSLVPKYLDSHPVCSDLCLFRIHLFHVLVTMPGAAPTCTQKYLNPLDVNDFMAAAVNNIEFKHLNWSSPKSVNCFSSVICSKSLYAPFLNENNNGSQFFRSYRVAST